MAIPKGYFIHKGKLFKHDFKGHKGRPGQVGGSLPDNTPNVSEGKKSKYETQKKTANELGKTVGGKGFRRPFDAQYLASYAPKSKMKAIQSKLSEMGFEKYTDDMKQDWVTSFASGKVRVHISNDPDASNLFITVSEAREELPHIPYD